MTKHPHPSQWFEDRVIGMITAREATHAVYSNQGGHRNACITVRGRELYPDLVLCDRETWRIEHIMEIETEESITEEKAKVWALESHGPWKFWLVVPRSAVAQVANLCSRSGVRTHIVTWTARSDSISIDWPALEPARGPRRIAPRFDGVPRPGSP